MGKKSYAFTNSENEHAILPSSDAHRTKMTPSLSPDWSLSKTEFAVFWLYLFKNTQFLFPEGNMWNRKSTQQELIICIVTGTPIDIRRKTCSFIVFLHLMLPLLTLNTFILKNFVHFTDIFRKTAPWPVMVWCPQPSQSWMKEVVITVFIYIKLGSVLQLWKQTIFTGISSHCTHRDRGFIFYKGLLKEANYLICLHHHCRHFCGYMKVIKLYRTRG